MRFSCGTLQRIDIEFAQCIKVGSKSANIHLCHARHKLRQANSEQQHAHCRMRIIIFDVALGSELGDEDHDNEGKCNTRLLQQIRRNGDIGIWHPGFTQSQVYCHVATLQHLIGDGPHSDAEDGSNEVVWEVHPKDVDKDAT